LAIKERILSDHLRAGEPVVADALARELQLSRTPIREALLQLAQEGFLEIRPRMGTFVAPLDVRRIHEMYQVRKVLEGAAARQAADFADPVALASLERELRELRTETSEDLHRLSECGDRLHRLIVDSCENQVLADLIRSLQDHFRRFRAISLQLPEKVLASHQEHLEILQALRESDGLRAEQLVHSHFEHAAQTLLQSLISPRQKL
jgi:DNA-binding GntR family transcriptional regulator